MEVKRTPTLCDRCLKTVSPVLVLDDCDLSADCMDDAPDPEVKICRECLQDMLHYIGLDHAAALTIDPSTGAVIRD